MKRRIAYKPLAVLLAGVVSLGLAGSGLVAQVSDTVGVRDNTIASEAYEAPGPTITLEVAEIADGGDCTNAVFEADGIVDVTAPAGSIDLATYIEEGAGFQIVGLQRFCLANTGSEAGSVSATLLSRESTEADACNATEAAAEQAAVDAGAIAAVTCAAGDAGELGLAGTIAAFPVLGQDCYQFQALFASVDAIDVPKPMSSGGVDLVLEPGELCEVEMQFRLTNEVPAAVPAATSDILTWNMAFTLAPQV